MNEQSTFISPCFRASIKIAMVCLISSISSSCGFGQGIIEQHETLCKKNARVIVRNSKLWKEYRAKSEIAFKKRKEQWGTDSGRALLEAVDGFAEVYGNDRTLNRPFVAGKIIRNDVLITKGNTVAGQLIDYIGQYGTIDGEVTFTCFRFGDSLYKF